MLRILFLADRFFHFIFGGWLKCRDFLLFRFSSPEERNQRSFKRFESQKEYAPGGMIFEKGFFEWEKDAIENFFPKKGEILVGACGGGREIEPLLHRGYSVTAFDGSKELITSAKEHFRSNSQVTLVEATFENFFPSTEKKFDGIILGWASFSNLTTTREREELLKSLKNHSKGPILLSFYLSKRRNNSYWPHAGFIHFYTEKEMRELLEKQGFSILSADFSSYPQPHVVVQKQ